MYKRTETRIASDAGTQVMTDTDLVRAAYDQAPSRPRLERFTAQKLRLVGEEETKQAERERLCARLAALNSGKGITDAAQRIIDTPADKPLFADGGSESIADDIRRVNRELETLRVAIRQLDHEIVLARAEVGAEVAKSIAPRHAEIVRETAKAGRAFVDGLRAECRLRATVDALDIAVALKVAVFFGLLTVEDNFEAMATWLRHMERDGFATE